jgi:hypothetical protein
MWIILLFALIEAPKPRALDGMNRTGFRGGLLA